MPIELIRSSNETKNTEEPITQRVISSQGDLQRTIRTSIVDEDRLIIPLDATDIADIYNT